MAIATIGIGLLPTYHTIGILAPILLLVLRLLQGIAVGGDLPGAITYVSEHAGHHQRGLFCGWVFCAINVGILLASFVGTLLTKAFSPSALLSWGWRIAFLSSVALMILGVYFRLKLRESPLYIELQQMQKVSKTPLSELWQKQHRMNLFIGIGIAWLLSVVIAQIFLYMPGYLHTYIHKNSLQTDNF